MSNISCSLSEWKNAPAPHLMMVFAEPVDASFAALGIDALYTPAGGEPVPVRVIAQAPRHDRTPRSQSACLEP
jgi:hypothetical protein